MYPLGMVTEVPQAGQGAKDVDSLNDVGSDVGVDKGDRVGIDVGNDVGDNLVGTKLGRAQVGDVEGT